MISIAPLPELSPLPLESLPSFLSHTTPLVFQQTWRRELQSGFMTGTVQLGADSRSLTGYALLKGENLKNTASQRGDRTWETGEVFEIFVKREDHSDYWEFHITPENFRLALHLPPVEERAGICIETLFERYWRELPAFQSHVWIEPDQSQWRVTWTLPWNSFGEEDPSAFKWKMAFCRYNADKEGGIPILSSTAPLTQLHFHRTHEWQEFQLPDFNSFH